MLTEHTITIRVRYQETDAQGRVYHGNYITYFELGRVELLRAAGLSYREIEAGGILLVVTEVGCEYFLPAEYDDLLQLTTRTVSARGARIEHHYEVRRDQTLLARGRTVVACIDRSGRVRRLPDWLRHAPVAGPAAGEGTNPADAAPPDTSAPPGSTPSPAEDDASASG